jgi:hypothetical protein
MKELDQKKVVAHKTRPEVRRAVEWMAALWIAGVEIESKKRK